MLHGGGSGALVVTNDGAGGELDVAGVPLAAIAKNRHHRRLVGSGEGLEYRREGSGEITVAIEDEKPRSEQRQGLPDGTAGAAQLRPVAGIPDPGTKAMTIAGERLDLFDEMASANYHIAQVLSRQKPQLMRDEGFAGNHQHGLGSYRGERMQPRRKAAGKNCNDGHGVRRSGIRKPEIKRQGRVHRPPFPAGIAVQPHGNSTQASSPGSGYAWCPAAPPARRPSSRGRHRCKRSKGADADRWLPRPFLQFR